jgi:hypothetical protein
MRTFCAQYIPYWYVLCTFFALYCDKYNTRKLRLIIKQNAYLTPPCISHGSSKRIHGKLPSVSP